MPKLVDAWIHRSFYRYGLFVYQYRWICILLPILLTGALASGFYFKEKRTNNNPLEVFAPTNGLWKVERGALSEHWPLKNESFWPGKYVDSIHFNDIVIAASDGGNILREEHIEAVSQINEYILYELSIPVTYRGETANVTYQDLCLNWQWKCFDNTHIGLLVDFHKFITNQSEFVQEIAIDIVEREIKYTYPIARRGSAAIYMGILMGGVHLTDEEGHWDSAKSVRLVYNLMQYPEIDPYSILWKKKLEDYLVNGESPSPLLRIGLYQSDTVQEGLLDISDQFMPKFAITFIVLTIFATLCSFVLLKREHFLGIDWVRSKPLFALAGVMTAGLGITSSFGLLLLCGMKFNAVTGVMPFLIISVGVDDMFIMTAAWHRTNLRAPTHERLARAMSEAAVSITITSITDFLAFAVGCIAVLPGIIMFCSYAAMGVLFTYIYQLTFFSGLMAVAGDLEARGGHSVYLMKAIEPEKADTFLKKLMMTGSHTEPQSTEPTKEIASLEVSDEEETLVSKFFRFHYGPFILHPISKIAVLILYITYITVAIWGCLFIKEGLEAKLLLLPDNQFIRFEDIMGKTFMTEGMVAQIVVNNPPDLSKYEVRQHILQMVHDFEGTEHTMAANATMFWLKEYIRYLESSNIVLENTTELWYDRVRSWLTFTQSKEDWISDMHWEGDQLKAFRFQIGIRHYRTAVEMRETTSILRGIAARYPEYNITTYHEFSPFADQYLIIVPSLMRSLGIAISCMVIVALILIPSVPAALLVSVAIISIDVGVVGFMSLWGVNLDSVTQIALVMNVGFAVDLSAHICYAYVHAEEVVGQGGTAHAIHALETVGWPVLLGAVSTVVGMLALTSVRAYVILTLFKTILLVIVLGLVHSMVFLPVLLTLVIPQADACMKRCSSSRSQKVGQVAPSPPIKATQLGSDVKNGDANKV